MGIQINGQTDTISAVDNNFSLAGNVSIGGTLTYEDVTSVDAVGLSTFKAGIQLDDSIAHLGDTDTKIRFPAADTFAVETAGSERLRINSTGRVGIGTNIPTALLHLKSNAPYITFEDDDNNQDWQIQATAWFAIRDQTNNAERLRITSGGKIGIGTNNPTDNLEILHTNGNGITFKTSQDHYAQITSDVNRTGVNSHLLAIEGHWNGTPVAEIALTTGSDTTNKDDGEIIFRTSSANNLNSNERLRINSSGQVSIGNNPTVASDAALHIELDGTREYLRLEGDGGGSNAYLEIEAPNNRRKAVIFKSGGTRRGVIGVGDSDEASATSLFLSASANIAGNSPHMVITSAGKIGLQGNTTPVAKLHIGTEDDAALTVQTLFVEGAKTGYANYTGLPQNQLCVYDNTASTAGSGGAISFAANCGGSQQTWIAAINSVREGNSNDASNYAGGLAFWTRPAQSTPLERMRVTNNGLTFNGDTAAANALDDYEEGAWVPNVTNGGVNWIDQHGVYTRIGNIVVVNMWLRASGTSSSTGGFSITGLPYASTTTSSRMTGAIRLYNPANYTGRSGAIAWMSGSSTQINCVEIDSNGKTTATNLNHNIWQNGAEVHVTMSYPV